MTSLESVKCHKHWSHHIIASTGDVVSHTFPTWSLFFPFSAISADLNIPLNKTYPPPLSKGRAYSCQTSNTEQQSLWATVSQAEGEKKGPSYICLAFCKLHIHLCVISSSVLSLMCACVYKCVPNTITKGFIQGSKHAIRSNRILTVELCESL